VAWKLVATTSGVDVLDVDVVGRAEKGAAVVLGASVVEEGAGVVVLGATVGATVVGWLVGGAVGVVVGDAVGVAVGAVDVKSGVTVTDHPVYCGDPVPAQQSSNKYRRATHC
jgi:hypothetical protein